MIWGRKAPWGGNKMQGYVELTRKHIDRSDGYAAAGGRTLLPVGGFAVFEGVAEVWIKTGHNFKDGFYCHENFDEVRSLIDTAQASGNCEGNALSEWDSKILNSGNYGGEASK